MSLLYFPPGLFPPSYFPPAYFPDEATAVPLPANLAKAIEARWSDEGLVATVGPLYQTQPNNKAQPPLAVYKLSGGGSFWRSDSDVFYDFRLTFRIQGTNAATAYAKAVLVDAAFDDTSLEWEGGYSTRLVRGPWSEGIDKDFWAGNLVKGWWQEIQYSVRASGDK